ncbi:serine/threonine-protein kinase [Halostreptopolyspora alba]|uniref:non-specific serine/threonine protein kinase n=1 Tax=Halostreptopolyspora alba TaxID=2487137 RepID=A0A3N0E3Z8_9ACTN|nr:serine/threonine protein kinase [Nocardiopsaceae bacterium YIM 96095]
MTQPETFGRYRVVRHLGSGSFATVWLAHDDRLDTPVAVKVLAENWAHQLDVQERFLGEARILRQADSRWLVRVHDLDVLPDERPYMVMTYADQGSVADLVAKGPLPLDEALRLLTEIGQGVTILHRHGTIHRDIKPSNVLLQSSPVGQRVLVADLGFAKAIDEASGFTAAAGTPGYMSPEQSVVGGDLDVRADVYSLGAVAYELVTGRRPPTPPIRVRPRQLRPSIPPALDELIMSCLADDREERPRDAATFTQRVRAIRMAPNLISAVPWWLRHQGAWARASLAAVAALLLLAGVAPSEAQPELSFTRVPDATGEISVAVPQAWARQVQPSGWAPRELGQTGGQQPGLLVATDVTRWRDTESPPSGIFAGLLRDPPGHHLDQIIDGAPCSSPSRGQRLSTEHWTGQVRQWHDCPGSFTAAALRPPDGGVLLYLEIRQREDQPHIVQEILEGARVEAAT